MSMVSTVISEVKIL